jgi:hypothetical protein
MNSVPIVAIVRLVNIYDLIYNGKKASHNQVSTAFHMKAFISCAST